MCGISGIWHFNNHAIEMEAIERATRRLRHRGPDDEGYLLVNTRTNRKALCAGSDTTRELDLPTIGQFKDDEFDLALGFRRLSILDLSPAGHQPMASADGKCWIIYNGEIYNYLELREELTREGYEFRTGTDTEVLLAAYKHWGVHCLSHFKGMWGFALWDEELRRLFIARDPFGIKPLYYIQDDGRFIFGSEIKALLQYSGVQRRANPRRLYEYLRSGVTDYGDETLFDGINQLPAAHYLIIEADRPQNARPVRYWQVEFKGEMDISFEEAAAHLRELFLKSVRLHLRSDVRVGAALSGGIDSSAIVTSMRAIDPQLDLHTFSYTAEDPSVSEERWVDLVSAAAQAQVHKVQPTPEELVSDLDQLIETQDEPFISTSIYAQHRVFRLARESGITVMLDGQGADEMLAGYRIYLVMRMASILRRGRLFEANRFLKQSAALPESAGLSGLNLLANAGGALLPEGLQSVRRLVKRSLGNGSNSAWLDERWFFERGVVPRRRMKTRTKLMLQEQLYETLSESSLPMLLRYEDRNSMAHSIESRVPFLTSDLAEFILALPEQHLISAEGTSKSVFRRAMRGIVPDAILDRRDKIGFATPEKRWIATLRPWVEKILASEAASQIPGLNRDIMREQWEAMLADRQAFDFRIWRWLNIVSWTQKFEVAF
jgi:asparagine synthase (glutamine-hydrolysing)